MLFFKIQYNTNMIRNLFGAFDIDEEICLFLYYTTFAID